MNILILTPDAVGSTLLQRLITIYMQFHDFGSPVINLHELTNGLEKVYSSDFNQEILWKPRNRPWGYYQTLQEIVELLSSTDHYKTARLAQYHIHGRQDSLADQIPFYQYLNDNFFIISCRRKNLFEHALSWGLNKITKKLNVYSPEEKINSFIEIYKNKVELDLTAFEQSLHQYKSYLSWSENNFTISSYFDYDTHLGQIEKYILNLPIFTAQKQKITWKDTYDIEFHDWNLAHYYLSNIGSVALERPNQLLALENQVDKSNNQNNATGTVNNIVSNLPTEQQIHINTHFKKYQTVSDSIKQMQHLGILVGTVPIKKQTFAEKRFMIKNFNQCLDIFNRWIELNPGIASPIPAEDIDNLINHDLERWRESDDSTDSRTDQLYLPPTN